MSSRSVILDEEHFKLAEDKARALGTSTDEFVTRLIETEQALGDLSFDELLAPVRKGFDQISDNDLHALFNDARAKTLDPKAK